MSFENALAQMEWHFGLNVESWRESKDGFYSLGSYAFGATIEPYYDKFLVRVGRSIGWGQDPGLLIARVEFDTLDDARIAAYIDSGECFGKAGAYAIQGRAAAFIRRIEGSYSGVMGLPLFELSRLL